MIDREGSDCMANEGAKKTSEKRVTKKRAVLYGYIGVLAVVTVLFGYNVLKYFYLDPLKVAGQPVYGYRTEGLQTISQDAISKAEQAGEGQSGVESVTITVQGPVVYFDVRVGDGVNIDDARAAAQVSANELLTQAKEIINDYNLQLVVSTGDIKEEAETNREEELAYIKEHDLAIVEQIVANAEKYPTATNIQRANANIDILAKSYQEEAEAFRARINALKELTAEEEQNLGTIPELVVDQSIKQSSLTTYPSWGVYDKTKETFEWK
ncbi:MAG: hypothetical protein UHI85_01200 [Turicibacter sp.]|nr:hypothetical protein [Turicibacter sp.]